MEQQALWTQVGRNKFGADVLMELEYQTDHKKQKLQLCLACRSKLQLPSPHSSEHPEWSHILNVSALSHDVGAKGLGGRSNQEDKWGTLWIFPKFTGFFTFIQAMFKEDKNSHDRNNIRYEPGKYLKTWGAVECPVV